MDFLTTALYSAGEFDEILMGALLTHFNPDSLVERPSVKFVDTASLIDGTGLAPQGFCVDAKGMLCADTISRSVFHGDTLDYVEQQAGVSKTKGLGLLDVVLQAADSGVQIVQNYEALLSGQEESPVLVPFTNLRVSKSSFNIYAPYLRNDSTFRTLSLIDIESDNCVPFVVSLNDEQLASLSGLASFLTEVDSIPWQSAKLYRVDAPLLPAYTYMGEAFVNYLAYSVAYYSIGLEVIDSFLADSNYVSPVVEMPVASDGVERRSKKPKHNVSIESTLHGACVSDVVRVIGDRPKLVELVRSKPEALATFDWMQIVFKAKPADSDWEGEAICQALLALKFEAKRKLLRFSVELLSQRYYVQSAGLLDDNLPDILKGGGVNGNAVKRVTW